MASDPTPPSSLEEVRSNIDALDRRIVALLAERSQQVKHAARFKRDTDAVKAPARVEQVITKVKALAVEAGVEATVVEATYRAMIGAFIEAELAEHQALQSGSGRHPMEVSKEMPHD
jgi:isochorismate pyruvate lyase